MVFEIAVVRVYESYNTWFQETSGSSYSVNKSAGCDDFSPRVLKERCDQLAPVLTTVFNQSLFNQSLATGEVPDIGHITWERLCLAP